MILQCFTNPDRQQIKILENFPKHSLLHLNFLKIYLWDYKEKTIGYCGQQEKENEKSKISSGYN